VSVLATFILLKQDGTQTFRMDSGELMSSKSSNADLYHEDGQDGVDNQHQQNLRRRRDTIISKINKDANDDDDDPSSLSSDRGRRGSNDRGPSSHQQQQAMSLQQPWQPKIIINDPPRRTLLLDLLSIMLVFTGLMWFATSFLLAKRSLDRTSHCHEAPALLEP
jgi:hypothetical protein